MRARVFCAGEIDPPPEAAAAAVLLPLPQVPRDAAGVSPEASAGVSPEASGAQRARSQRRPFT